MRKPILTALVAGALSAAPLVAFGQTSTANPPAKPSSTASPATPSQPAAKSQPAKNESAAHSTRGVVKSINDSTLVITRNGKNAGDMTLALNASTQRDGTIAVGTPVSVRYTHEGKNFVATAITAQAKAPAAQAKPSASSTSTGAPKK